MRVHVVVREPAEDSVVPRLMRELCATAGWTLSDEPDPHADWNHWGLYLDLVERFPDWTRTLRSAYFSHLETDYPIKAERWREASGLADLRIVTAPMYRDMLAPTGPTALCRPAVDRQFRIRRGPRGSPPLVGVAGFVRPPSARKGSELARLVARKLEGKVQFAALGVGWPFPCRTVPWQQVPRWFAHLDGFLCTSLVEGVPMPPLEALACGLPIIVPRGVGMLDSLPDVHGVWRYDAGDLNSLARALRAFARAEDRGDPETLRACVAEYTAESWAADHMAAFKLLDSVTDDELEADEWLLIGPPLEVTGDLGRVGTVDTSAQTVGTCAEVPTVSHVARATRGAYFVAYGEPAQEGAERAVAAFRRYMPPDVQIAVASGRPVPGADLHVAAPDADVGGRSVKTRMYDLAPAEWGQVLYMDADTEVTKPDAAWLFRPLDDGWDMVITTNPGKFHVARRMRRPDNESECQATFAVMGTEEIVQLNGGVLAFRRNERTRAFFEAWHAEWSRWGKRDQAALLRALWRCPVRVFVVGNEWNTILPYCPADPNWTAGIMHHVVSVRRWTGQIDGRSDSQEAWSRVELFKSRGGKQRDYKRR